MFIIFKTEILHSIINYVLSEISEVATVGPNNSPAISGSVRSSVLEEGGSADTALSGTASSLLARLQQQVAHMQVPA